MAIKASSLYEEVLALIKGAQAPAFFELTCTVHTPEGDIEPLTLNGFEVARNYEERYGDEYILELSFGLGTLINKIQPFKNELKVTLTTKFLRRETNEVDLDIAPRTKTFYATLMDSKDYGLMASNDLGADADIGDRSKSMDVDLQLFDPLVDDMRFLEIQGIYPGNVEAVMKTLMDPRHHTVDAPANQTITKKDLMEGNYNVVAGVEVVPVTNTHEYDHIVVKPGTRLMDLPIYLQKQYGVYDRAIGRFLQNGIMHVYPLLDTDRFGSAKEVLTIATIDSTAMPGAEKTHTTDNGNTFILATGETLHDDLSEVLQLNYGNGKRFVKSSRVMDVYGETSKNKTKLSRGENLSEFLIEERKGNANRAVFSSEVITDNFCREVSSMARRRGAVTSLQWHNSDPDKVKPGMPVRLLYMRGTEVEAVHGTVLQSTHLYSTEQQGKVNTRVQCNSVLKIFIKRI